ncbi:GMC oxidoreductase [Jannaschia seohaensis]|uniref:Choline dehydrogenase n=1 Tax=Jannaschia seohaensis TaxID=475081 RepID=A0A2Y9ATF2_9RHOB|nr:GMC oxidoreductase [Jannaschia seohaensis]PWJ17545.1 choline dehydrogenase-like flavoprotein [Jannaschia seohaensis]SSA47691.1 Choline dehydrogenase [Jannaschia seohaensis]
MIIDLNSGDGPAEGAYDTCIIGAGAAGITLARKLAQAGRRVALCEGGLDYYTDASQDVYRGEILGDPYFPLDSCRLRFLGGSTNHWGGMCRVFDPVDFERGDLGPEFEWPIRADAIAPFLAEACALVDVDPAFGDGPVDGSARVKHIDFKFSPPTLFEQKYRAELERSDQIDLYLAANFLDLESDGQTASSARFANYDGAQVTIPADRFVLAMGGIENSRMLLWLDARHGGRFFDAGLPIGRYWMEHPRTRVGEAIVSTSVEELEYFGLRSSVLRANGIMNCRLELDRQGRDRTRRLLNEILCIAPGLGRRLVALADRNLVCGVRMRTSSEQAPFADNRIALSEARDKFGIPFSELHWRTRQIDRDTILSSCLLFNEWLVDNDLGRIRLEDWLADGGDWPEHEDYGGNHHMGGTRMGRRDLSVVDENCRIHGSDNIYVAGSSVFATSGHANPTLPLLQFTLRLAAHLTA